MSKIYNQSSGHNLKLLWWLRNIAIIGQSTAVYISSLYITLPTNELWLIIAGLATVNILTLFRFVPKAVITDLEFFAQLLVDITALALLLYFSGGATNPFATLFVLQVIIAATTLPAVYTWVTSGITIGLYSLLMVWRVNIPELEHHHMDMTESFNLHIKGMWIGYIVLVLLVAWFVVRMSKTIRRQDLLLAEAERIASLGTLATAAAHELGTPLATMAVVSGELESDVRDEAARKSVKLIREQIAKCKDIISDITRRSGMMRAESGKVMSLGEFVKTIVIDRKLHDETDYAGLKQEIVAEYALKQAVGNILDNAFNHSPDYVGFKAEVKRGQLVILVEDKGKGISAEMLDSIGELGISTRPEGMGMGLYLSKAIVNRFEGEIGFANKKTGGLEVTIKIPMQKIRA